MKKLLNSNEMFADCRSVYNEDSSSFTTIGEPRGTMKQVNCDWANETDYIMLGMAFKQLGLDDYIQMCLHENKLYIRINEEV